MNAPQRRSDLVPFVAKEDQYTIARWSKQTFGARSPLVIAKRAAVEMAELIDGLEALSADMANSNMSDAEIHERQVAAATEAADVNIMLLSVVNGLKQDMTQLIDVKMAINRQREWHQDPTTGRTQHVKRTETTVAAVLRTMEHAYKPAPELKTKDFTLFKEPGSGLAMSPDRWYVLSDSGACYSSRGFETADGARAYFASPSYAEAYGGKLDLDQPSYLPPVGEETCGGWDDAWGVANVVLGRDMFNFWLTNDAECLCELNPELFK
jgi:hypothetical protein